MDDSIVTFEGGTGGLHKSTSVTIFTTARVLLDYSVENRRLDARYQFQQYAIHIGRAYPRPIRLALIDHIFDKAQILVH